MATIFKHVVLILAMLLAIGCGDDNYMIVLNDGNDAEISGTAQKGPYLIGSSITLYELDDDFHQTGVSFQTETIDSTGKYTLPARLKSKYVDVFVQGFYFDEISGYASSAPLVLSAIAEVNGDSTINLNILTTLARHRIYRLVADGTEFRSAVATAQAEVIAMFNIGDDSMRLDFTKMRVLEGGAANAFLLAASAILMQMAHDSKQGIAPTAALSEILSIARIDLEADGLLDDDELMGHLATAKENLDLYQIRSVMESEFPDAVIPAFEAYFPDHGIVTGEITGSVLYEGQGLSGVEILLRDNIANTQYQHTDNEGWYRFYGVPSGTFQLIPRKDGFRFIPEQTEISRIASESSVVDFEAVAVAKVFYDHGEFLSATGDNEIEDFENGLDTSIISIPAGELFQELVNLEHEFWFSGEASPPTFVLCNAPGFDVHFTTDVLALGFHYSPFAADTVLGESLMQWTLYDSTGEIIETHDALAPGFLFNSSQHFFGIISSRPFRSVSIRQIRGNGTDGFHNWMIDDLRWADEVRQNLF